jgi:hypothetical protein
MNQGTQKSLQTLYNFDFDDNTAEPDEDDLDWLDELLAIYGEEATA